MWLGFNILNPYAFLSRRPALVPPRHILPNHPFLGMKGSVAMKKPSQYSRMTPIILAIALGSVFSVPGFVRAETLPAGTADQLKAAQETAQQKLTQQNMQQQAQQNAFQQVKAQTTEAVTNTVRAAVIGAVEKLQGLLAAARTKVTAAKNINSADQSRLVAVLDGETRWLAEQSSALQQAPLSVMKQRAAAISGHRGQIKAVVQRVLGEMQALQLQATADRLQTQAVRSQRLVDKLAARGKAPTELTEAAKAYTDAAAKTFAQCKQGVQFFQSFPTSVPVSGIADNAYKAGTAQLDAARSQIKQTNAQLQALTALIKAAVNSN